MSEDAGAAALREALRAAAADGASILPCGNRTRLARHAPAAAPDRWLSLAPYRRILRLDPGDHTCEVEAGAPPAALEAAAAEHGLGLGVLAPHAASGTLGGLFLAPDVSLLADRYGPPRDQVLGASWLLADGEAVRTGARVVKSVAGYDVTRLFLGSRGRLAVCTSLILRLRPRPRETGWARVERQALAGAPRAGLRLAFTLAADAGACWLQYEGPLPRELRASAAEPERGTRALSSTLDGFASSPQRLHASLENLALLDPRRDARLRAVDLLGAQAAWDAPAGAATPAGLVARVIPQREPSPWLAAIAEACAPGWPALGIRGGYGLSSTSAPPAP